jgi:hypothetical protein
MCQKHWHGDTLFLLLEEDWRPAATDVDDPVAVFDLLVKLCIFAESHGMGEFVWLTWESSKTGNRPHYGNLAQGWSIPFANLVHQRTLTCHPADRKNSHWDVYLLGLLGEKQFARGAAYVTPAVGGYYAHESGCEPRLTGRDRICDWQKPWRAAVDNDMVLQLGIPGTLSLSIHPFLPSTSPCIFRFRTANSVLWNKRLQEFGGIWYVSSEFFDTCLHPVRFR